VRAGARAVGSRAGREAEAATAEAEGEPNGRGGAAEGAGVLLGYWGEVTPCGQKKRRRVG
jgi:hypothetical protein